MSDLGEEGKTGVAPSDPEIYGESPKIDRRKRKRKQYIAEDGVVENGGLEREIFGKWTVFLRNIGGITAVMVTCLVAVLNAVTTNISVTSGGKWPSEITLLILNIGPFAIAVTYANANKTIQTIMGFATTATKIRAKAASIIAPKVQSDDPQQPPQ